MTATTSEVDQCPKCRSLDREVVQRGCLRTPNDWHQQPAPDAPVPEMVEMTVVLKVRRDRLSYGRWWVEYPSGQGRTWGRDEFRWWGLTPPGQDNR